MPPTPSSGPDISEMFQLVLDSIPVRVFWKDRNLVYQGSNTLFARDAGFSKPEQLIGLTDFGLGWTKEQADAFRSDDKEVIEADSPKLHIVERQDHPDGKTHWLETNKVPLRGADGSVIGVMGTYTDITERKEHEQQISYLANHDELTGLPNRRSLISSIVENEAADNDSGWAGLMFIDLDQFKAINDSLGHEFGDALLREVAIRLDSLLPVEFPVCRLGGDEFAIFVSGISGGRQAARSLLTGYAADIFHAFTAPFEIDPHCLYVGASVGISLTPPGESTDVVKSFREADMAMYTAKARGHNSFQIYDDDVERVSSRRNDLQNRLRQSDSETCFELVYQPQFNTVGTLTGCEALIRWHDAELGTVSPSDFIPLAETTGMIHKIGDWVLRSAFDQLAAWEKAGVLPPEFHLAVNVSTTQFWDKKFVRNIRRHAEACGVNPGQIEIEITETQPLEQVEFIVGALSELADAGFRLVIDDFGAGYSSLSYLTRIELTKLKIDRSIVTDIHENPRQRAIANSIIQLSNNLNVTVVGEGVETERERECLGELGCEYYQGYLYGAGCSPREFETRHFS